MGGGDSFSSPLLSCVRCHILQLAPVTWKCVSQPLIYGALRVTPVRFRVKPVALMCRGVRAHRRRSSPSEMCTVSLGLPARVHYGVRALVCEADAPPRAVSFLSVLTHIYI